MNKWTGKQTRARKFRLQNEAHTMVSLPVFGGCPPTAPSLQKRNFEQFKPVGQKGEQFYSRHVIS